MNGSPFYLGWLTLLFYKSSSSILFLCILRYAINRSLQSLKFIKCEFCTVEQLMYAYAEHTKYLHRVGDKYGWDETTYRANIGKIRNYIVPTFGGREIWEITSSELRQGFKEMLDLPQANGNHKPNGKNVSQRTVYDCKKINSRAFKYAVEELEIISINPMIGVNVKQVASSRRKVWTQQQFKLFYENCEDSQLRLFIALMIVLSCRVGECLALQWSDIYDQEDSSEMSYIRVNKELLFRSEEFAKETDGKGIIKMFDKVPSNNPTSRRRAVLHRTKTERQIDESKDKVYVPTEVILMLREHKKLQEEHKRNAGASYVDDNMVFAHEDGRYLSGDYIRALFRRAYEPLGFPYVHLYSLKHFSITMKLAINGHDYVSLAKDTAHKQISTIQEYYETPEDTVRIKTAEQLGEFLSGKEEKKPLDQNKKADDDEFTRRLEEAANSESGKILLDFAIKMIEENNQKDKKKGKMGDNE